MLNHLRLIFILLFMQDALMNLIPFALSKETNLLVDVADVPSGKKCACICPSCEIPLVARKGEINEWHFAHDSQYIDKDQELACDFSWAVAVKMMIKQLIIEGGSLTLPDYYIPFQGIGYQKHERYIKVTDSSTVQYEHAAIKSLSCDVTIDVKGKKLGIILLTKHSPSFVDSTFHESLLGVLAIDIERVGFNHDGKIVNHLRKHLKLLLEHEVSTKHWLYHAREKGAYKKALEEDNNSLMSSDVEKSPSEKEQRHPQVVQPQQWYCHACHLEYQGSVIGLNPCPNCHSHFFRIEFK